MNILSFRIFFRNKKIRYRIFHQIFSIFYLRRRKFHFSKHSREIYKTTIRFLTFQQPIWYITKKYNMKTPSQHNTIHSKTKTNYSSQTHYWHKHESIHKIKYTLNCNWIFKSVSFASRYMLRSNWNIKLNSRRSFHVRFLIMFETKSELKHFIYKQHTRMKGNFRTGGKVSALKVQTESSYVSSTFVKRTTRTLECDVLANI